MTTTSSLSPMVDPSDWTMSITEDLVLPFDATGDLMSGEVPVSPAASLYDISQNAIVPLANAPTITGPDVNGHYFVNQRVSGPEGDLPHVGDYTLTITFVASPTTNKWAMELRLHVIP